jgi:copper chaperone
VITWSLDNVKCSGCANRIIQKLQALDHVSAVALEVNQGALSFEAPQSSWSDIEKTLVALGYPRSGTTTGLAAVSADVRSVVSCAIGRFQSDSDPS